MSTQLSLTINPVVLKRKELIRKQTEAFYDSIPFILLLEFLHSFWIVSHSSLSVILPMISVRLILYLPRFPQLNS